ncbi:glycosyltransferase family 2 protein [Aliiroseovarius sp. YM-037]|uniref:glycosyltransferase family 2 protein n=1 Tax=Aliiroseovarius sp. YM-037 TaxID=3341728 RepID=UPI003A812E67
MSAAAKPRVSVIMANYNGAAHIGAAISSVLVQSMPDLELIVSDDGSSDESVAIVERMMKRDPRLRLVEATANGGPAAARNRALDVAIGEWIAIVDADDILHPQRFERLIEAAHDMNYTGVADDLIYFRETPGYRPETLLGQQFPKGSFEVTAAQMVDTQNGSQPPFGYLKPILRRDHLEALRYREDIRIGEDHDLYLRFLLNGGRLRVLRQSYYLYRRHGQSVSHRFTPDDVEGMIRVQDDLKQGYPDMDHELTALMESRARLLNKSLAYEKVVQDLKNRRYTGALAKLGRKPTLTAKLARSVKEHVAKRRMNGDGGADLPKNVVLLAEGQRIDDFPSAARQARQIAVPRAGESWDAEDWARVTASSNPASVFAQGEAGVFALGFLPDWNVAHLLPEDGAWPDAARKLASLHGSQVSDAGPGGKIVRLEDVERPARQRDQAADTGTQADNAQMRP